MILVDTSVLIDYLKGKENTKSLAFQNILDTSLPYGINNFILQEVLQGAKNQNEFNKLKNYLETLTFYTLKSDKKSFINAAYLNMQCRQKGITIRSTIDFLIAETAIENDLYLLHNDEDFTNIAKIVPELKIY